MPAGQRADFVTAVIACYGEHPVAERRPDTLGIVRQDDRVFAEILRSILGEDLPPIASPHRFFLRTTKGPSPNDHPRSTSTREVILNDQVRNARPVTRRPPR